MSEDKAVQLLPCPFCKGPGSVDYDGGNENYPQRWRCGCNTCDAWLPFVWGSNCWRPVEEQDKKAKDDAIRAWNTRASLDSKPATEQAEPTWAGAAPFVQHVQVAAGAAGSEGRWPDEFLAWYKPSDWLGEHRAGAVFLGAKFAAQQATQPARVPLTEEQIQKATNTFEPHGSASKSWITDVARAIERAHGIVGDGNG